MTQRKILIVGCGNMGAALGRGLCLSKEAGQIALTVHDQHAEKAEGLKKHGPVTVVTDLKKLEMKFDAVVLCVKPQDLEILKGALGGRIGVDTLVISILAGTTIEDIGTTLAYKGPIVRSMPNIAATVGAAATGMAMNELVEAKHKALTETIFRAVGEAYWTKESLLDTVTGLSGSGPAYIYMVIEALTDGGVKNGLPRDLSLGLAVQTVLGAATMVKQTGIHPAILKDQVTTPAGTTICAIHELEAHGLRSMFVDAVSTATERSKVLRQKK